MSHLRTLVANQVLSRIRAFLGVFCPDFYSDIEDFTQILCRYLPKNLAVGTSDHHHGNFPCHPHPTYFHVLCPLPSVLIKYLHCYDAGCSQLIRKGQGEREPASSSSQCKILWKVTYLLCHDAAWQLEEVFDVYFPRGEYSQGQVQLFSFVHLSKQP